MLNNAGLMPQALLEKLQIDEWNRMIDVNLKGVLYGIAAALPYMVRQKSGHFIQVSSVAGHKVGPGFAVYAATKFGVRAPSEGRLPGAQDVCLSVRRRRPLRHMDQMHDYSEMPFAANKARPSREAR